MELIDIIQFLGFLVTNIFILARFLSKIETKLDHLFHGLTDERGNVDVYTKGQVKKKLEIRDEQLQGHGSRLSDLEITTENVKTRLKNLEDRIV